MAEFKGEKLTLENIADSSQLTVDSKPVIEKLNLIITTNTKTYDTSIYNVYRYDTLQITNVTGNVKPLVLAKKGNVSQADLVVGDDVVIIYPNTVQDIKIKSVRDFLKNQMSLAKK